MCVLVTNLLVAPLTAPLLRRLRLHTEPGSPRASLGVCSSTNDAEGVLRSSMPQPLLSAAINGGSADPASAPPLRREPSRHETLRLAPSP